MKTEACQTCYAMIPVQMIERHEEWHDRISSVAIEHTQRIDALTERLKRMPDAYL